MKSGRSLNVGDYATTDYNGSELVTVRIVERDDTKSRGNSQSGILFRVHPPLKNGNQNSWYDADWFKKVPSNEQ